MENVTRRTVLKMAGGMAGLGFGGKLLAVFDDGSVIRQGQSIPASKGLSPAWKRSLTARGTKEVWSGDALESIGMPVGGIAAGQLYLKGDGTLGWWEIFNHHQFYGYGLTSYAKRPVPRSVDFGFALVESPSGLEHVLDSSGFDKIEFRGEHPIGTITYSKPGLPVKVVKRVFSPFIPMNAKDSSLPATVLEFDLTNTSNASVTFALRAHLENAVARSQGDAAVRQTRLLAKGFLHSADKAIDEFADLPEGGQGAILIADFEGSTYGNWKVEGEAFGPGPAQGTLPGQNEVSGYDGKGLVNTFFRGDDTVGRLVSPPFTVQRRFINFKIGGGRHPGKTCINLLVDGKVVRTSTGLNDERLLWDTWNVEEFRGKSATLEIVDDQKGPWGHINIDSIEQADSVRSRDDLKLRHGDKNVDWGTMALVLVSGSGTASETGEIAATQMTLKPGETKSLAFALAWHFPNHQRGRQYANWFKDAADVANYVATNYARLSRETKLWRDTYYNSTLPYWLLDRLHSTVGNLATGTTEWWGNGRFWAWEGVVCCSGTCTHVWNYEHALARLFPEIERNIRERQDFDAGFHAESGLVGFRSDANYAADGQCGTILKAYREHQTSADTRFLKTNWPRIKKALEYLIERDGNDDGMLEDSQPNTYDIDFFGANTFVGALYLAALRAGEEMATEMKDAAFAKRCHNLFERGSEQTVKRLWNGEYFVQKFDESKFKEYQYGPGCLSDQLFGQGWAHQVGLGHLYPADKVRTALQSVWKYNWTPDVGPYNKQWPPERPYAVPGEAGLFICTWPSGGRQKDPVRYRDEVWTGIEYQVAGNMVWEGLVEEGLSICRAIHDRYHPAKRNPYNEVECSDHYARALASWGVYTALAGFAYHGPRGELTFAPKVTPEHFKAAFTAAEGWGTYEQRSAKGKFEAKLELKYGKLAVRKLTFETGAQGAIKVQGPSSLAVTVSREGNRLTVEFGKAVSLKAGQSLSVAVG